MQTHVNTWHTFHRHILDYLTFEPQNYLCVSTLYSCYRSVYIFQVIHQSLQCLLFCDPNLVSFQRELQEAITSTLIWGKLLLTSNQNSLNNNVGDTSSLLKSGYTSSFLSMMKVTNSGLLVLLLIISLENVECHFVTFLDYLYGWGVLKIQFNISYYGPYYYNLTSFSISFSSTEERNLFLS